MMKTLSFLVFLYPSVFSFFKVSFRAPFGTRKVLRKGKKMLRKVIFYEKGPNIIKISQKFTYFKKF